MTKGGGPDALVRWVYENAKVVGQVAKRQASTNPETPFFRLSGLWGRRFDEVRKDQMVPYNVVPSGDHVRAGRREGAYSFRRFRR